MSIGGATRLVGIIGDPVTHSLSPEMHNAAFAALGLDFAYVPLPVPPDRVGEAVAGLRALGFRGANVTMPHKAAVAALPRRGVERRAPDRRRQHHRRRRGAPGRAYDRR